ncbi:MAG: Hsp20/alpha crystallin family protein [Gammaproteobacteria bacterium]|nr:MAG: Hsp20/alpha crystallin family protein [Gammaproteobacteria bacterium]
MTLLRYEPYRVVNQLNRDIGRLFDGWMVRGDDDPGVGVYDWTPAVDIKEEKDSYVIHADLPGIDRKDIEVSMENGVLTIHGERKIDHEEEKVNYKRVERVRGSFFRRFTLPDTANQDQVNANYKDGVLSVVIYKHEKLQPRKIEVSA